MLDPDAFKRLTLAFQKLKGEMESVAELLRPVVEALVPLQVELFVIEFQLDCELDSIADWSLLELFD